MGIYNKNHIVLLVPMVTYESKWLLIVNKTSNTTATATATTTATSTNGG